MPRITGLPRGMVPRYTPPADMSRFYGSYRAEVRRLETAASDADWRGDHAKADKLRAELAVVRREQDEAHTDVMPLF